MTGVNGVSVVKAVKVVRDGAVGPVLRDSTAVATSWKRNLAISTSLVVSVIITGCHIVAWCSVEI